MDQARLAIIKEKRNIRARRTELHHKRVKQKDGTIKRLWLDLKGKIIKEDIIRKG